MKSMFSKMLALKSKFAGSLECKRKSNQNNIIQQFQCDEISNFEFRILNAYCMNLVQNLLLTSVK